MIPLGMFLKASNSIYGNSWTTKGLKLISWSWQQIGLGARVCRQDGLPEEQFVMIENVEVWTSTFTAFDDSKYYIGGRH